MIDPQDVVHETVDGEVILIALQTGCYYSLEGSGADVWQGLVAGRSSREIAADLEQRYSAEPGVILASVSDLVARLVDERLVSQHGNGTPAQESDGKAAGPATRPPFPHPVFHKFTDMQDFLLVDPIHDVGDAGWPHAAVP